jgi:uncharacterized protein (DUF433 family)
MAYHEPIATLASSPLATNEVNEMTRNLSLPEVRVQELAVATAVPAKDIYRIAKGLRDRGRVRAVAIKTSAASMTLAGIEAVAVAASLRIGKRVSADRTQMAKVLLDYLQSKEEHTFVEVDRAVHLDAAILTSEVVSMIKSFKAKQALIELNPAVRNGEPVYKGTSISIHTVATRLSLGDSVEEIMGDLPNLSREAILAAPELAAAHPLRGRPRKQTHAPIASGLDANQLVDLLKDRQKKSTSKN